MCGTSTPVRRVFYTSIRESAAETGTTMVAMNSPLSPGFWKRSTIGSTAHTVISMPLSNDGIIYGELAERSIAAVLKTVGGKTPVSSNLTLSATHI